MKQSDFTILMTLDSIEQAYVIKSVLEANGVACQIINATAQSVLRAHGVMWGIRLMILTSQVELANQILEARANEIQDWNNAVIIEDLDDENFDYGEAEEEFF